MIEKMEIHKFIKDKKYKKMISEVKKQMKE